MSHPGEELVIVHEGAMVFTVDGEEYELGAGDSIHFRTLLRHSWRNPSAGTGARATWLVCSAPRMRRLLDALLESVADAIYLVGPRRPRALRQPGRRRGARL